jgi:large subunit ribosomal protein L31
MPEWTIAAGSTYRGTNSIDEAAPMQAEIHPKYGEMTATCSCGNVIKTRSTLAKAIQVEVCAACHPFYTGKQKVMDSGGRIDRFKRRFGGRGTGAKS